MDGITLLRQTAELLNEDYDTSGFTDDKVGYEFLWQAAVEFNNRTRALSTTTTLTTAVDGTDHVLPADFLQLYLKDDFDRYYVAYSDGTTTSFIYEETKDTIIFANNTNSVSVPSRFYIGDEELDTTTLTGTATDTGAKVAGQSTLTDSTGDFEDDGVQPGDTVHNETDNSSGYILSVTSGTALVVALFDGDSNDWTTDDVYTIVLQPRLKLVVDPPTSTADHTMTVHYIQRPEPVFSNYGRYRFKSEFSSALTRYAAWLYKYRDKMPDEGDRWYSFFDRQVRQYGLKVGRAFGRKRWDVKLRG